MKFLRKIKDKIIFFRIRRLKYNFQMKIIENLNEQNFKSFIQKNPNFNLKKKLIIFAVIVFYVLVFLRQKINLITKILIFIIKNGKISE